MKGIMLSERYYKYYGRPMIENKFYDFKDKIAVGLVGEGSECYGFDDKLSQDHDWGPGFCMWLNKSDFDLIGEELQYEYEQLPSEFAGLLVKDVQNRVGVFEIGQFYGRFIGLNEPPILWNEWIKIPEIYLSVCTNGKIFEDVHGEFSFFRKKLLEFYPEDIRLKLIASRCVAIAKEGQYNFSRSLRRNELVAANHSLTIFIISTISLTFLLNYSYRPYHKWMHRAVFYLPILGKEIYALLAKIMLAEQAIEPKRDYQELIIAKICDILLEELKNQQLTDLKSRFFLDHSKAIEEKISNPDIKEYILVGNELM